MIKRSFFIIIKIIIKTILKFVKISKGNKLSMLNNGSSHMGKVNVREALAPIRPHQNKKRRPTTTMQVRGESD